MRHELKHTVILKIVNFALCSLDLNNVCENILLAYRSKLMFTYFGHGCTKTLTNDFIELPTPVESVVLI